LAESFHGEFFQKSRSQDLQGPHFRKRELIITIKLSVIKPLFLCRLTFASIWKFVVSDISASLAIFQKVQHPEISIWISELRTYMN